MLAIISFGITALLSVFCIVHLWRRNDDSRTWKRKLAWTLAIAVPGIGALLYGAVYTPLSAHSVRGSLDPTDFYGYK